MRTPAGQDCRYYHQDFHRGRHIQECRLIQENSESLPWRPVDCTGCPIPEILKANASRDLELKLTVKPRLLGLGRQKEITAACSKHHVPIEDPYVGCPQCNAERPGLEIFREALDDGDEQ